MSIPRFAMSPAETIYWAVAITMLGAFMITLALWLDDSRTIDGIASVWTKPLKFELSLAIHAATLALVLSGLSDAYRAGTAMLLIASLFLCACVLEMGYIISQAAKAQHSHFNVSTPFYPAMYSMMALAAIVIIGAAAAVGVATGLDTDTRMGLPLRVGIVFGLVGGTLLTIFTALTIGSRMSPYVGVTPAADGRMLMTGWSRTSGDLRVSHFLGTHMIQAIPLLALAVERLLPARLATSLVIIVCISWSVWTLAEYRNALNGIPSRMAQVLR